MAPNESPAAHRRNNIIVPSEQREIDKKTAKTTNVAREAALAFMEADVNADGKLTWEEFKDAVQRLRTKEGVSDAVLSIEDEDAMHSLFTAIDVNKSGTVEVDEYFLWTLDVASVQGGGLVHIFEKYDNGGEGMLDASEFALAIEDLGFTSTFAHDLFVEMDEDNSGAISYKELNVTIKRHVKNMSTNAKALVASLAFHDAQEWAQAQQHVGPQSSPAAPRGPSIETVTSSGWTGSLKGPDSESLRQQLQSLLLHNKLRDSDLYNLLVAPLFRGDPTRPLTRKVFVDGFIRLGYCGPSGMVGTLFKRMDTDSGGIVGFFELREWMVGRVRRKQSGRTVHLYLKRTDKENVATLQWSSNLIKQELVAMLQRNELTPLDLVRAWDASNDFSFSRREFLIMMKKLLYTPGVADDRNLPTYVAPPKNKVLARLAGEDEGASQIFSFEQAATHAAATRVQAAWTGRRARIRTRAVSKEVGDKIWYSTIKPLVQEIFESIGGADDVLDIQEFVQWLNEEWRAQRLQQKMLAQDDATGQEATAQQQDKEKRSAGGARTSLRNSTITKEARMRDQATQPGAVDEPGKLAEDEPIASRGGLYQDEYHSSQLAVLKKAGRLDAFCAVGVIAEPDASPQRLSLLASSCSASTLPLAIAPPHRSAPANSHPLRHESPAGHDAHRRATVARRRPPSAPLMSSMSTGEMRRQLWKNIDQLRDLTDALKGGLSSQVPTEQDSLVQTAPPAATSPSATFQTSAFQSWVPTRAPMDPPPSLQQQSKPPAFAYTFYLPGLAPPVARSKAPRTATQTRSGLRRENHRASRGTKDAWMDRPLL